MHTQALTTAHLADATVVERDPRGIKVLRLPNGHYLKVFRLRHRYGWARLHGYAQRFCKHAQKLQARKIPTVRVLQCLRVEDETLLHYPLGEKPLHAKTTSTAPGFRHTYVVAYAPLEGETLKHLLEQARLTDKHVAQLGAFIAQLHASGIYFRSLHLGNIVLTPDAQMGLIDIADMDIYRWPLWFSTRLRSFRHLTRYAALNQQFGLHNWQQLLDHYIQHASLNRLEVLWLRSKMRHFLLHPPH